MNEYEKSLREKDGKKKKKTAIKTLIKKLHQGEKPKDLKKEFADVIRGITPDEISRIEEELIEEGMPREEMHRLCDVHIEVFKDDLENTGSIAPPGHPINTLMEEHRLQMEFADELKKLATRIMASDGPGAVAGELEQLEHIAGHFVEAESHYVREENVLFPYLEKHGITQPPKIMWTEHDTIREIKKDLRELADRHAGMDFPDFAARLNEVAISLAETLASHFYKENNILFPTALKVIEDGEWKEIRQQFDELGYCCFTPEPPEIDFPGKEPGEAGEPGDQPGATESGTRGKGGIPERDMIEFETGKLSFVEVESIFDTLPVDITFVGKDDTVRYFSQSPERIFPRAKAIIGRTVQNCHPQKSLDKVTAILEGFKQGKKEPAEFWINMGDMLVYIRYFPVHNKKGEYLGTLEVTQDIAPIKKIEGEKRLL